MTQTPETNFSSLEESIGYQFRDKSLLRQALTHPSYSNENEGSPDNQRLEFLGDAVLDLLTAEYVYRRVPSGNEGILTVLRTQCVSGEALAAVAEGIDLGANLLISAGSQTRAQRGLQRNLAAALEALLGAAWLDGGVTAVTKIFDRLFTPRATSIRADIFAKNPKGELQTLAQSLFNELPHYTLVSREGPAHMRSFTVQVELAGCSAIGTGSRLRSAQAQAAANWLALHNMRKED